MPEPVKDDLEILRSTLYTSVIGDILDQLGLYHQFLPPEIRPIPGTTMIVGRAMPVQIVDVFGTQKQPFGKLTEALDQLEPDDVYLATGGSIPCACWGEIMTQTARVRGAAGAVLDGHHRDTRGVIAQQWPVFSRGSFGQDAAVRTQVSDYRCPIEIGGVRIVPGDIVFGDVDGVVVIPQDRLSEVIGAALDKVRSEQRVMEEIGEGLSSTEAFRKYGIL